MMFVDYLIIGSGAAGLSLAIKLGQRFPERSLIVLTKSEASESNTNYAQGGIAVVQNLQNDSLQNHIQDTLKAGDGLCNEKIVEMVVNEAPLALEELISLGPNFDKDPMGMLDLGVEGGHTARRVVHSKDKTGQEVEKTLLKTARRLVNIQILENHFAIDLLWENENGSEKKVIGVYGIEKPTLKSFSIQSAFTILSTGGCGSIYARSSNPSIATGDGIAMAHRVQAKTSHLEFVQFHPTVLASNNKEPSFLISEAVRGYGAYIRNEKGDRFMFDYDARGEMASRDIVSRAIYQELAKSSINHVYLDMTHLDADDFVQSFPNITRKCKEQGYDIKVEWLPVVPAAHFMCGGVQVDEHGRSSLKNLFACGECSFTGLHGANRLASNAILEAVVYANRIFRFLEKEKYTPKGAVNYESNNSFTELNIFEQYYVRLQIEQLQELMSEYVGIIRNFEGLRNARITLNNIKQNVDVIQNSGRTSIEFLELRNMLVVSELIVDQATARKENKGGHFNANLEEHTIVT